MKIHLPNFALFKRTLLMDSRHWQGYLAKFLLLGTIFLMLLSFADEFRYSTFVSAPGLKFLEWLANINLVAISLLGVAAFVPAITEEKEVDSLGLLLMTGISPLSTILSKGGGKLLSGVALIVAQIPFTFLAVMLGGVSSVHIAATYVLLASYMLAIAGLALFLSVIFNKTATAGGVCFVCVLLFNIFIPTGATTRWLSPFDRMSEIFATGFMGPVVSTQAIVYAGFGALCLLMAWALFDVCSRRSGGLVPIRVGLGAGGKKPLLKFLRPGRVWKNALIWKAFHFDAGGKFSMATISAVLVGCVGLVLYLEPNGYRSTTRVIGETIVTVGFIALFVEGMYVSGAVFRNEVNANTLSTLFTLPVSPPYIIYSKVVGAALIAIPTIVFLGVGLSLVLDDVSSALSNSGFCAVAITIFTAAVLYYHITAYLSLKIKYGAFIVAGFALFMAYMFMGFMMAAVTWGIGPGAEWVFVFIFCSVHVPFIVFFHALIINDLRRLAGA
jgi:ABC-type Na+ efflux pump permease subunit